MIWGLPVEAYSISLLLLLAASPTLTLPAMTSRRPASSKSPLSLADMPTLIVPPFAERQPVAGIVNVPLVDNVIDNALVRRKVPLGKKSEVAKAALLSENAEAVTFNMELGEVPLLIVSLLK